MSSAVPFLPGYCTETTTKKNFAKSHLFDVQNGIRVDTALATNLTDQRSFPVSNEATLMLNSTSNFADGQDAKFRTTNASLNGTSSLPAWIAYDRKVLRFYAYFKEAVFSSQIENYRLRRCILYYYLEDDSVHIAEPKVENSGIAQGVFVKRHRVPKANNELINLNDLRIGSTLNVYGRNFRLYACDDFTRQFFGESGVELGESEECPADAFTKKNTVEVETFKKLMHPMKEYQEARAGKQMGIDIKATQKFFKNDGRVLRFFCVWNDTKLYGEPRPLELNYFLADDTVEVMEVKETNAGRDPFPALCSRGKLPVKYTETSPDLTNIGGTKNPRVQYYTEADLRIGGFINVYGRELEIRACDDFTKRFYIMNYGFTEEDFPVFEEEETDAAPRIAPPPYNNYGTEEDSLGSFLYLIPKVPKSNYKKLVENDGLNLRWLSKFKNPTPEDKNRRFILTFFMANDTISIFEKFQRNSGFIGGKFSERHRMKNPFTGEYYSQKDMTAGTTIRLNHFDFEIIEPDVFTQNYIAKNPHLFSAPPAAADNEEVTF
jgi:hypothetical protein